MAITHINKNTLYYLIVLSLFITLKFWFTIADNNSLIFLLKPTDKIIELLSGSNSVYFSDNGFYHEELNIVIGKSCAGFNFWILSFLVFTYLLIKYMESDLYKILSIPIVFLCTYIFTIFVNTSRIFASIIVLHQTNMLFTNRQHLVHEAIGIITNLSFLVLFYYIIEKNLKNKYKYAKLT